MVWTRLLQAIALTLVVGTSSHAAPQREPGTPAAASALTQLQRVAQAQQPALAAPAPQAQPAAAADPVGSVATLQGTARVTRGANSSLLKVGDAIIKGDLLQTGPNSALGATFDDETTFNLSANASLTVDEFVYQMSGVRNSAVYNIARGTVAFVANRIAKSGDMRISTPTATLGIRGTTGLVEVPEGASAAGGGDVAIKLYPDADGRVGRIEVFGGGARLGILSRAATGFAIRRNAAQQFAAIALQISAQQAARDRTFVRGVFSAQGIGRRFVIQRRNLRLQNLQQRPRLQQQRLQRGPQLQRLPRGPNLQQQPPLRRLRGLQEPPILQGRPALRDPPVPRRRLDRRDLDLDRRQLPLPR
jgi:hypothetical protein